MKTLGVIPARGGSKGIPDKNIKLLNGIPLIVYSIIAAQKSTIDRVVVSTDCEKIKSISESYGVEVIMRKPGLSNDNSPTLPVIQEAFSKCGCDYDAIVTLQPTSPLRSEEDINKALSIFKNSPDADALVSVVEVPHQYLPSKVMRLEDGYLVGDNKPKRRQDVEVMYARNGAAIYITRSVRVEEYIFGGKILPFFMSKIDSFDIDDEEDWEIVSKLISHTSESALQVDYE